MKGLGNAALSFSFRKILYFQDTLTEIMKCLIFEILSGFCLGPIGLLLDSVTLRIGHFFSPRVFLPEQFYIDILSVNTAFNNARVSARSIISASSQCSTKVLVQAHCFFLDFRDKKSSDFGLGDVFKGEVQVISISRDDCFTPESCRSYLFDS